MKIARKTKMILMVVLALCGVVLLAALTPELSYAHKAKVFHQSLNEDKIGQSFAQLVDISRNEAHTEDNTLLAKDFWLAVNDKDIDVEEAKAWEFDGELTSHTELIFIDGLDLALRAAVAAKDHITTRSLLIVGKVAFPSWYMRQLAYVGIVHCSAMYDTLDSVILWKQITQFLPEVQEKTPSYVLATSYLYRDCYKEAIEVRKKYFPNLKKPLGWREEILLVIEINAVENLSGTLEAKNLRDEYIELGFLPSDYEDKTAELLGSLENRSNLSLLEIMQKSKK